MWRAAVLAGGLALAMVTAVPAARAQERPAPSLTGSVRGGYWSSTRDLDARAPLGAGMVWLKGSTPLSGRATLLAEGWAALRGPPESADATVELREAFVALALGALDVRLGRQVLAWGRADGVNPTGNLAAEDLTLLTPDDADRRLGTTAVVASYFVGGVSVSGLWLPEFRGHRFPLPTGGGGGSFVRDHPEWPGDQWAVRVERTGGAVDWSTSVFQGLDLTPDLAPTGMPGRATLRNHRIRVLGADAATTLGQFGVRAEGAYVHTTDAGGVDPFTKNPYLFAVVGADRTFDGRVNVNVQYLLRRVAHFASAPADESPEVAALATQQAILSSQARRTQHGASMRASCKWLHETLETEWAAIGYLAPRGIAMRPKVTYALSDRISTIAGAELFRGRGGSMFQLLRPNSVAYLEARWGF
jgi:uncharacterized protein DUF1302